MGMICNGNSPQGRYCKECGAFMGEYDKFCSSCGQTSRCEKCNAPLNPGAKQCENCGHKTCDDLPLS